MNQNNHELDTDEMLEVMLCMLLDNELQRKDIGYALKLILDDEKLQKKLLSFIEVNELLTKLFKENRVTFKSKYQH
tara:strand:- start:253 stop:480 length:228 start_codon:yes stop_codon:yes gene_type:complete